MPNGPGVPRPPHSTTREGSPTSWDQAFPHPSLHALSLGVIPLLCSRSFSQRLKHLGAAFVPLSALLWQAQMRSRCLRHLSGHISLTNPQKAGESPLRGSGKKTGAGRQAPLYSDSKRRFDGFHGGTPETLSGYRQGQSGRLGREHPPALEDDCIERGKNCPHFSHRKYGRMLSADGRNSVPPVPRAPCTWGLRNVARRNIPDSTRNTRRNRHRRPAQMVQD